MKKHLLIVFFLSILQGYAQVPKVLNIENKAGNLEYTFASNDQYIIISGENLTNVFVFPGRTELFKVHFSSITSTTKTFRLEFLTETIEDGKYDFLVNELLPNGSSTLLKDFPIFVANPRIPQRIVNVLKISQGEDVKNIGTSRSFNVQTPSSSDAIIEFLIDRLQVVTGPQSFQIKVSYYNSDNSLIFTDENPLNGKSEMILRRGGLPQKVVLDISNNMLDRIRPFGYAIVTISHSPDFYRQDLDLKEVENIRINFIPKVRTTITASLTVPPAIMIYGKDEKHEIQLLPINVGFGLNFSFRKGPAENFRKKNLELGLYIAGLNFAGDTESNNDTVDDDSNKFIRKGDIAVMALGQINLRRTDNFVKLPIIFGVGFTLPVNGLTSRGFIALGVGININ